MKLSESVIGAFEDIAADGTKQRLSSGEVSNIVYRHDIRQIRDLVCDYLWHKGDTWILFDNLDKGWPPNGLEPIDITILRCLIDASRKIQREMRKREIELRSVVFVRNDVFELLMQNSADFGKEMRVSLDWSDADLLRDMLYRRIKSAAPDLEGDFHALWTALAVSHYQGEDSFYYLLDRSLMRPRNVIKILLHCRGAAVNSGHKKIEDADIEKGLMIYSNDVLIEADQELADIDAKARDVMYQFIGISPELGMDELWALLERHGISSDSWDRLVEYLLYYGFLGISPPGGEATYIYNVSYNMKLLEARLSGLGDAVRFHLNPAFWPILDIKATI